MRFLQVNPSAFKDVGERRRIQMVVYFLALNVCLSSFALTFSMAGILGAPLWEDVFWIVYTMGLIALGLSRCAARALPIAMVFSFLLFGMARSIIADRSGFVDPTVFAIRMMRALILNPTICSFLVPFQVLLFILATDFIWVASIFLFFRPQPTFVFKEMAVAVLFYYCLLGFSIRLQRQTEADAREKAESLELARDKALEVSRLKSQFVATMSYGSCVIVYLGELISLQTRDSYAAQRCPGFDPLAARHAAERCAARVGRQRPRQRPPAPVAGQPDPGLCAAGERQAGACHRGV
jgi:hypothetical protein